MISIRIFVTVLSIILLVLDLPIHHVFTEEPNIEKNIKDILSGMNEENYEEIREKIADFGEVGTNSAVKALMRRYQLWDLNPHINIAFKKIGNNAVAPLIEWLNDNDPEKRCFAVRALSIIGTEKAEDAVIALYHIEKDIFVKGELIQAFCKLNADKVLPLLLAEIKNKNFFIVRCAFFALQEMKIPQCSDEMTKIYENEREKMWIRVEAASVLALMGNRNAINFLIKASEDFDPAVRSASVGYLSKLNDPAFDGIFLNKLRDPDKSVQIAAIFAVFMTNKGEYAKFVAELCDDEDEEVRNLADCFSQYLESLNNTDRRNIESN